MLLLSVVRIFAFYIVVIFPCCAMPCASFDRTMGGGGSSSGGKDLVVAPPLLLLLLLWLEQAPAGQHTKGKLIDIFIGNIPQIGDEGRTSALNVIDGGSVWFKFARFGQRAAAAAHEQSDGAFLELFDGPRSNVLGTASMTKIEKHVMLL